MNTTRILILPALGFILDPSTFCLREVAQSYSIDWFTIDGGGPAMAGSTGGVYSVSSIPLCGTSMMPATP